VFASVRSKLEQPWGVIGYPLAELNEEVAFIACHFHWSSEEILNLDKIVKSYSTRWLGV
jgi:hypothetical protein